MTNRTLGRLTRVDLRDIWATEASDFTPWLAREENLVVLSETLDMELELEAQEKAVGSFRADILCKVSAELQDGVFSDMRDATVKAVRPKNRVVWRSRVEGGRPCCRSAKPAGPRPAGMWRRLRQRLTRQ